MEILSKPPVNDVKGKLYQIIFNNQEVRQHLDTVRKATGVKEAVDALFTFISFRMLCLKYLYLIRCKIHVIKKRIRGC